MTVISSNLDCECHCWWTEEPLRAHVAKFYGRLRLIRSVLRVTKFFVKILTEIVNLWVYYTIAFGFSLIWYILGILFNFNRFNHTSWVTAVTPTDRPRSVLNSCVIKDFGGVFMLSRCFLDCSVGVGGFVKGLSQISSSL